MTGIIDISRTLRRGMPVWPGDTPFSYDVSWTMEESGSVNVGKLSMSTHIGTHVDAPFHFENKGEKISELDLNTYIGKAIVVEVAGKESIGPEDLAKYNLEGAERLLIKTGSWKDGSVFPDEITYLQPGLGPFLANAGIRLIGLDVPSVDPIDSKELLAHHSLYENNILILEALNLEGVDEGEYELIAFPLKIEGADGSPVRAVLRPYK